MYLEQRGTPGLPVLGLCGGPGLYGVVLLGSNVNMDMSSETGSVVWQVYDSDSVHVASVKDLTLYTGDIASCSCPDSIGCPVLGFTPT